jgi:hypothetical protein
VGYHKPTVVLHFLTDIQRPTALLGPTPPSPFPPLQTFVLIPMPYLFFTNASQGWADLGRFVTGIAGVALLAVPGTLYRSGTITVGAFLTEITGSILVLTSGLMFDAGWAAEESSYSYI